MIKSLRLTADSLEGDPLKIEYCRRAVCTVVTMDHTLSPSLNMPCLCTFEQRFKNPYSEKDLESIGRSETACIDPLEVKPPHLIAEISNLSQMFCQVCVYHREGGHTNDLPDLERRHSEWQTKLPEIVIDSGAKSGALRQLLYLHLLYHHIGQLLCFPSLRSKASAQPDFDKHSQNIIQCHYHASIITEIVKSGWEIAGLDVHNASFGQILTVAAAVHMHACLTANSKQQRETSYANITVITDCIVRVRKHCRLFDRISAQLDTFLQICSRSSNSRTIFDHNERLLHHILHYGTAFERLGQRKTGQIADLAEPLENSPGRAQELQDPESIHFSATPMDDDFQNCAWLYSDSSLNDLYTMPYFDFDISML